MGRGSRSHIPNSLNYEKERCLPVQRHHERQLKRFEWKGRKSRDDFRLGDLVRVKCYRTGRWDTKAKIIGVRGSNSSSSLATYEIECSHGGTGIHNRYYLKPDVTVVDESQQDQPTCAVPDACVSTDNRQTASGSAVETQA